MTVAVSVRMDPVLERELEAAARRKGQTKSQFIVDAVERALGHKNPYELLMQVEEEVAAYRLTDHAPAAKAAPGGTKARVRAVLQEKHGARQQQWVEGRAAPASPKRSRRTS
jgi:RHH-type rel operon transcriptional repressor/antitoxin RelB